MAADTLQPEHAPRPRPRRRKARAPGEPAFARTHAAEGVSDGGTDTPDYAAAAAAMLPAELLQPGEIIILLLKPSPWFILLAPLKTVLLLAVITGIAAALPLYQTAITSQQIVLAGLTLIALRLFWQFLEWLSRVYVLTDQRVVRVMGVLRISVFEAPLQQVQHTTLLFSIRERFLGLGTLGFATAGTGGLEAFWQMIAKPYDVHQKVVQTLRRYRR